MAINDLDGGADTPSFAHVAVCVGSDAEGEPVTIVDRLCLNNAAAVQVASDLAHADQQHRLLTESMWQAVRERDVAEQKRMFFQSLSLIEVAVMFVMAWIIAKRTTS